MNPNQNQPTNNIPSIKQSGNWSPLNDPSYDLPPQPSFFKRWKKLIIIVAVSVVFLIGLAITASLTSPSAKYQEGPKTSLQLENYDKQFFSMSYPKGLNISIDEGSVDGKSWYLSFAENIENSPYNLSVYSTDQAPFYSSSEEGLLEQQELGVEVTNVSTSDVVLAGVQTKKSVGQITSSDGKDYYVVFSGTNVGERYVMVTARYLKDNTLIHDSFDAVIGSIKLK